MACPYNPEEDGAKMSFKEDMSYGDYLQLSKILDAQNPLSNAHDEFLFIVQHQTSELWMRLAIHEMQLARKSVAADDVQTTSKVISRVARIFEQLNSAWDVLRTMTPSEYTEFRESLGASSGFQSHQYRLIEFMVGNRNKAMIKPHAHDERLKKILEDELTKPSIYDEVLYLMNRSGIALPKEVLERDVSKAYEYQEAVMEGWKQVYQDPKKYWALYEMGEKLVDFEDYFRRWRFNHVTTVERVIGFKRGTGGTGGVNYLKRMLSVELFPELWAVRTHL